MSEPTTKSTAIERISGQLLHWRLHDDRINNRSDSYALKTAEGLVLIDPLPLEEPLVDLLEKAVAICLTGRFHQRSAWRYQERFNIPVYVPYNGEGFSGTPDHLYQPGDKLPGGLEPIQARGPCDDHYIFYRDDASERLMFIADLLIRRTETETFKFVPDQYMDDPEITRDSVRALLNYPIDLLCPNHGAVHQDSVHAAVQHALERDGVA